MLTALLLAATVNTYVSERCGFSFDYPATWTAAENPKAKIENPDNSELADCAVGLRPPDWETEMKFEDGDVFELNRYPVRVVKWNRSFKESAQASHFKQVSPHEWHIYVRQGTDLARMFVTECCQGVRGVSWGHGYSRNDETVTVIWEGAVVNDRKGHSIVIESDFADGFEPVVTQIIESVRFHSSRSAP